MEFSDYPIGYFITWTVYGTFLQGDLRWWRKKAAGQQPPRPNLERWHRDRLQHEIILLNQEHRQTVNVEIEKHCVHRRWKLWNANPRTNHVHVIISAAGCTGKTVRDQLKANCTRGLRQTDRQFINRPVWTTKGDVQLLATEDELARVVTYVSEAQDRMEQGK